MNSKKAKLDLDTVLKTIERIRESSSKKCKRSAKKKTATSLATKGNGAGGERGFDDKKLTLSFDFQDLPFNSIDYESSSQFS